MNLSPQNMVLTALLFLALIVLPVMAILSILRHKFRERYQIIWLVVVFILPMVGPLIYFLVGRRYWVK